jgi:probable rRNA maturation factor
MPHRKLTLRNRQRVKPLDLRLLRRVVLELLDQSEVPPAFDLGVYVVGEAEMTHLNETFLRHGGSTDVITFDYNDPAAPEFLCGEIFVCVDEALLQAPRFRATWQCELVRYIVHGLLHLQGFDDHHPARRRRMKREEAHRLQHLMRSFNLARLQPPKAARGKPAQRA